MSCFCRLSQAECCSGKCEGTDRSYRLRLERQVCARLFWRFVTEFFHPLLRSMLQIRESMLTKSALHQHQDSSLDSWNESSPSCGRRHLDLVVLISCALEEYQGPNKAPRYRTLSHELLVVSAKDSSTLSKNLLALKKVDDFAFLAWKSQQEYDVSLSHRVAIVACDLEDAHTKIDLVLGRLDKGAFASPNGVHYTIDAKRKACLSLSGTRQSILQYGCRTCL